MAQFFLGEYDVPVDEKGRVFLPADLRRKLLPEDGDTLVVTTGLDGCLNAHPHQAWSEIATRIADLPQTDQNARQYYRVVFSQAAEVRLDRQGRATLPKKLLDRAGISDRMVIAGAGRKLEFWEPESWNSYLTPAQAELTHSAEGLPL